MERPSCPIPQLDDRTFEEAVLASPFPVLVHFAQRDCEGCKLANLWPTAGVQEPYSRVNSFCIQGAKNPRVTARYRVRQYPTILVLREGRVVRRLVGHPLPGELEFILRAELPRGA